MSPASQPRPAPAEEPATAEPPARLDAQEHLTLRLALSERGRTEALVRLAQLEHRAACEQADRVAAALAQKYGDCRIEEDGRITRTAGPVHGAAEQAGGPER